VVDLGIIRLPGRHLVLCGRSERGPKYSNLVYLLQKETFKLICPLTSRSWIWAIVAGMDRLWLICKGSKNGRYCEVGFYCPDYEYMGVIVLEVFACFGVVGGSLIVQKAAVLLLRSAGGETCWIGDLLTIAASLSIQGLEDIHI